MLTRLVALLALAFAPAIVPLAGCAAKSRAEAPATALAPLSIAARGGVRRYRVELALTGAEQERGLMFRTSLPRHGGMLFPFDRERPASFWMKNTVIPLDIIFIRADRRIARIAAMTKPYSLDLVESGEPVVAVLELAGGEAARAGIAAGDLVDWQQPR